MLNPLAADFRITGDFLQLPAAVDEVAATARHSLRATVATFSADAGNDSGSGGLPANHAPWVRRPYSEATPALALHEEMVDLVAFLAPTPTEESMRHDVVHRITSIVAGLWPQAVVEVLGSFRNGVYLPTSDIDLVVTGRWPTLPLRTLANALNREGLPSKMTVIAKARVRGIICFDRALPIPVSAS